MYQMLRYQMLHKALKVLVSIQAAVLLSLVLAQPTSYNEAPTLAERVQAGELPPVEERLPTKPIEGIGSYGGDWRVAVVGGQYSHVARYQGYENLVRWTPNWDGIIPNIAESFEVNEDSTEYTFYLREGMRWSDGAPFTADDIMFWYEDVFLNEQLTPAKPSNLMVGGEPVIVEKLNDYAVVFRFAAPNGLFLQQVAEVGPSPFTKYPRHHLEEFHPTYNPENIDRLVQEAGVADWMTLFQQVKGGTHEVDDYFRVSNVPTLYAWYFTLAPGDGTATRAIAVRNPYYWKVDPAGNQLPYLDRLTYDLLSDNEVLLLKVLGGEIDWLDQHFATPTNKPVVIDGQDRGDYRLFTTTSTIPNSMTIQLNLNHPDPVKNAIFQDKDFRIGLSHAIDRQEIIDLVFVGQGEPYQVAPASDSPFYNEQLAKQYIEYDVELANEHLDRVLPERDAQGFRLGPDGNRLTIIMELDVNRLTFVDAAELIQAYWQAVGVDIQVRTMDRSLWEVRVRGDGIDWDATIHSFGGGSGYAVLLDPRYYFPFNANSIFAKAWSVWYNNPTGQGSGIAPVEPPADVRRQMELYDQIRVTGDLDTQLELMMEILEIAAEQFYVIGISTEPDGYGIAKNNLRNVQMTMPWSWIFPHPAPTNPQLWYWDMGSTTGR
jgi:peptide/nickel transport system substrate-binding protein